MPLPAFAGIDELSEQVGVALSADSLDGARALAYLDSASAWIRSYAGKDWIDDEGDLEEEIPDIIAKICIAAASRAYRNPDGTTQTSVGDVSVSFSRESGGSAVYLTTAEQQACRRAAGGSAVNSITLVTPYIGAVDLLWAPTEGDPIPLGPLPWETF